MKKIALLTLLSLSTLLANNTKAEDIDGYDIFKRDCNGCHIEMISKADTLKGLKDGSIVAPPMIEVAKRIQQIITVNLDNDEAREFVHVSFIKAYLKKPDIFTSLCQAHAKEKFGAMPAQTQLTDAEAEAVAVWILERYEDVPF